MQVNYNAAIDAEKSLSWNNTTTKNKFLEAMGMTNNDDMGYFDRFTEYYSGYKNDDSAFWTNASSGSALAEEASHSGASPPAYKPLTLPRNCV